MQSKEELEKWYEKEDPWGYRVTSDDFLRKSKILIELNKINNGLSFKRALDVGAGEGWVTEALPAREIHAIELSDMAAARFPVNVKRVKEPEGEYDLVVATGVLYPQYDFKQMLEWIEDSATHIVLLCNIKNWLVPEVSILGKPVVESTFKYREYNEWLQIFDVSTTQHRREEKL